MTQTSTIRGEERVASGRSTDRRSIRSRALLRDALAAEVVESGDIAHVTVTAVAERAGVTRRTFYSHYADIADLVNCIEDDTIAELEPLVAHIAATSIPELKAAIEQLEPCPGSEELLSYFKERAAYLPALLGEGGDPAFAEHLKTLVHQTVAPRALDGIDARALGAFFDYYLTFVISAEVGVLVRWIAGGMQEDVGIMARVMTMLAFVRPGDLYGNPIDFDMPALGLALMNVHGIDLERNNDD